MRLLALLSSIAVVLSGCAGEAEKASTSSTVPFAPTAVADEATGAVSGRVTDDELRPIASAVVGAVEQKLQTKTDARGNFTLNGLAPGKHRIVVSALGFEAGQRVVEVVAGEVEHVQITLATLVDVTTPYNRTQLRVAQMHVSWVYLTHALWAQGVNNSQYNSLICDPCKFVVYLEKNPEAVMHETLFKAGIMNPAVNNQVYLWYAKDAKEDLGTSVYSGYAKHRSSFHWLDSAVKAIKGRDNIHLLVQGDLLSVNYEIRVEIYTSFAYRGPFDDGFTALPPA